MKREFVVDEIFHITIQIVLIVGAYYLVEDINTVSAMYLMLILNNVHNRKRFR